jgi:hypothetical protein
MHPKKVAFSECVENCPGSVMNVDRLARRKTVNIIKAASNAMAVSREPEA